MRQIPLCDMKKGERSVIKELKIQGSLRRRLMDMGFVEGTAVECAGISPAGDPKAFRVRGTVIALRKEDAAQILGVAE